MCGFVKMEGRKRANMIVRSGNSQKGDQLAFVLDVSSSVQFSSNPFIQPVTVRTGSKLLKYVHILI